MITLVAISGAYGAGGSVIGRDLAERLSVPFLDRAIPAKVAESLSMPLEEVAEHDGRISRGWPEKMLSGFLGQDAGTPTWLPADTVTSEDFKLATEQVLLQQAQTGKGVILGRAGIVVLGGRDDVLRVRLDGPKERRERQAMLIEGIDEDTAKRRLADTDKAHDAYAGHFYATDIHDPTLYDIVLDSTTIPFSTCVQLLAYAAWLPLRNGQAPASSLAGADQPQGGV